MNHGSALSSKPWNNSHASLLCCAPAAASVGTNIRKPTLELTHEDFTALMAVNVESAWNLSQLVSPARETGK